MATSLLEKPARKLGPLGSPAISVRRVTKRFGAVTAVEDLSFEVRPGVRHEVHARPPSPGGLPAPTTMPRRSIGRGCNRRSAVRPASAGW
jgi:hypothetical protein